MEEWREWLYPLGFLSSLAFGARVIVQWLSSEIQQKSTVGKTFWKFSLLGNVLLMIHSFIQIQFHVCLIQACNGVISWRNLNLMHNKRNRVALSTVIAMFIGAITLVFAGFIWQNGETWFRIPTSFLNHLAGNQVNANWHVVGFIGLVLFASRFWVQWWGAEKHQVSYLGPAFWWVSLVGDFLCLIYFARILDPVNLIGPALGLIPYVRNLMLIKKSSKIEMAHEHTIE